MTTVSTPLGVPLAQALRQSAPLAQLAARLAESNARHACIRGLLPTGLAPHVAAGPVDDDGWSLLAANPAVAAKLRQLLPRLDEALAAQGFPAKPIRVRIQGRTLAG